MGIVVSSHGSDFPVPLEKPSSIKSLRDVPEDIKALNILLCLLYTSDAADDSIHCPSAPEKEGIGASFQSLCSPHVAQGT